MSYRNIYVPLDGSDLSNTAMHMAVEIAKRNQARLTGSHVYAARLHDQRFRAMESGLPEKYRKEKELDKQRKVHESLITKGLELISDSYLMAMDQLCRENELVFNAVSLEGRNWRELLKDVESQAYDLVVLGGHGVGRVAESLLGTVTERILRRIRKDVLICKADDEEVSPETIVVCLDGSSHSWGALERAIQLAKVFGKKLVALSAYDPYFHYTMFSTLKNVLTDKARKVFKFEEQEKLHETIIDSGLAKIYQSHLDVARRVGKDREVEIETHLLDGKAYPAILGYVRKYPPWLLVLGRLGIHSDKEMDIGGNTENLCRLSRCNILMVDTTAEVPVEYRIKETVTWTKEAKSRMGMVPEMARGVAMTAVQNHCLAEGHTVITTSVLNAAIRNLLPPEAIEKMGIDLGDDASAAPEGAGQIVAAYQCPACEQIHRGKRPRKCAVCGGEGDGFRPVSDAPVRNGVAAHSMDGRDLTWERECLEALERIENPVLRREIRMKLEKRALTQSVSSVTMEMLRGYLPDASAEAPPGGSGETEGVQGALVWTDAAALRLERVPEGFMRKAALSTVEAFARGRGIAEITLEVAEGGLGKAREKMAQAMQGGMGHGAGHAMGQPGPPTHTATDESGSSDEARRDESLTAAHKLPWDDDALERLGRVPEGFMRTLTRGRIEQWAREHAHRRITIEVVEAKYASWQEGSRNLEMEMPWREDALARIERIPEFIRPMVSREIERHARAMNKTEVDGRVLDRVMQRWGEDHEFHSHKR